MNKLVQALGNTAFTENGALSNMSSGSALLDFFYHAAARRGQDNTRLFEEAFSEEATAAVVAAFYTRDIRGGQGERKTFRDCLLWLSVYAPGAFHAIAKLVPEYGRWDDLIQFVDDPVVFELVRSQLQADLYGEHPSLLGKWMPSHNASSKATKALACKWMKALGSTPREYRLLLTDLRKRIKIVETQMCAKQWGEIEYQRVPSKAMTNYRKAFGRHDQERFAAYLAAVEKGEKKINASVTYPYEIVSKLRTEHIRFSAFGNVEGVTSTDQTLELQWKALPDYTGGDKKALVIADVSGSMLSPNLPGSQAVPMDVSVSLAVYFAERNKGPFANCFLTFETRPSFVTLQGHTLVEKIANVMRAPWGGSTDIEAAFGMILDTAKRNHVAQADMPEVVFVVSDMQFNPSRMCGTNFSSFQRMYQQAGFRMPRLVFWNVASRVDETPVTMHDENTYLVSGCSPSVFKSALACQATTPYDMMIEVLESERYRPLWKALG